MDKSWDFWGQLRIIIGQIFGRIFGGNGRIFGIRPKPIFPVSVVHYNNVNAMIEHEANKLFSFLTGIKFQKGFKMTHFFFLLNIVGLVAKISLRNKH